MIDSCSPSKLDPGFPAMYSMPRSRRTWTIRSDPGRTTARSPDRGATGGRTLPASRSTCPGEGGGAESGAALLSCPAAALATGTLVSAAAPAAAVAAPFKKPRRVTALSVFFDFAIFEPPEKRQPDQVPTRCPIIASPGRQDNRLGDVSDPVAREARGRHFRPTPGRRLDRAGYW